jgi:hypothetical protein
MKNFKQDIISFKNKLESKEHFSFSKYADGEWAVMKNHKINNKEFWFDPNNESDQVKRKALMESFQYQNPRYYVGISCPCCQGMETFKEMKEFSGQANEKLTWANLWVNGNYRYYVENIIPLFKQRPVVLFCNENGNRENLPFIPYIVFPVKHNAWEYNWDIIEHAKSVTSMLKRQGIYNLIYLFCCGPFGNILCHQLTKHEPDNTYLDIGSTLNPWLQSAGFERHYYMGDNFFSRMECVWGQ